MDKSIKENILNSYNTLGGINHLEGSNLPSWDSIKEIIALIRKILFPGFFGHGLVTNANIKKTLSDRLKQLEKMFCVEILKSLHSEHPEMTQKESQAICIAFMAYIPELRAKLKKDSDAIFEGDPAASNESEIILSYQGFQAIVVYRVAHFFWSKGVPLIPRLMSEIAHSETGVEIHPGAEIGERFCIDHGTGIVIGSSAVIGNNVKLYQGVTLGALSVPNRNVNDKRHPTIEDNVTIYAGATILGGKTIIGQGSIIGGNVWITSSIPAGSKIYLSVNHARNKKQIELSQDPQI